MGFRNQQVHLPILLSADDGLVLPQSRKETEQMIQILTRLSEECGLTISKEKSVVLVYNNDENTSEIKEIQGIPVKNEIKYLGIKVFNKKDLFVAQRKDIIKKTQKMENLTHSIICKSCNKLLIGKKKILENLSIARNSECCKHHNPHRERNCPA